MSHIYITIHYVFDNILVLTKHSMLNKICYYYSSRQNLVRTYPRTLFKIRCCHLAHLDIGLKLCILTVNSEILITCKSDLLTSINILTSFS